VSMLFRSFLGEDFGFDLKLLCSEKTIAPLYKALKCTMNYWKALSRNLD
jgi:hypothetical protein